MPNLRIRREEPRDIPQLRALLDDELVGQAAYSLVNVDDGAHEHFMVAALDDATPGSARGHVRFHSAFAEA